MASPSESKLVDVVPQIDSLAELNICDIKIALEKSKLRRAFEEWYDQTYNHAKRDAWYYEDRLDLGWGEHYDGW